jgi:hypothetical protein
MSIQSCRPHFESNFPRLILVMAYNVPPFGGNLPRLRNLIAPLTLELISAKFRQGDR